VWEFMFQGSEYAHTPGVMAGQLWMDSTGPLQAPDPS